MTVCVYGVIPSPRLMLLSLEKEEHFNNHVNRYYLGGLDFKWQGCNEVDT